MMSSSRVAVSGRGGRFPPDDHFWTFLSNHAHVLVCIADDPDVRLRDVAERVGVTERAVHRIVTELETAGVLRRVREGRRNHYELDVSLPLRHPVERHKTVGDLLAPLLAPSAEERDG